MSAPRRYLVVDDNRAFAENVAEILGESGAQVVVAGSGQEALEAVRRERFSVLITDMRMPVMNGARVVHEIRALDPSLPIIVVSAYSGSSDLEDARREGLLAVLPKPIPMQQLMHLVSHAQRNGLVALVEDDEAMRDNLTEVLRSHGFTVVSAGSVLETRGLACVRPFAAVVDLRVPGGPDGEAMVALEARYRGLPMFVITAHHEVTPPVSPRAVFPKPFQTEALLARLSELHQQEGAAP